VDLALHTSFPVTLFWGPEFILVYNEAYVSLIGDKHPSALGSPAREVFPEAWDLIGPMMQDVLDGKGSTWVEDQLVPLLRRGFLEECFFTFSYSLVRGADGAAEGVLDIAAETTAQVHDRRRLALLSRLNARLVDLEDAEELQAQALRLLRDMPADLAAVDIRLSGVPGPDNDPRLPRAPAVPLGSSGVVVEETAPGRVAWAPLGAPGRAGQPVLVVLLNEQLAVDVSYLSFVRLVAAALVQALDRAMAREAERRIATAERDMSEALQRSLLTRPRQPAGLEVAVRYQPAALQAQIGGDWYDSFELPDGTLTVVIGDVAGHDQQAAAVMAEVRNVLRGVALTLQTNPASVLSALDGALRGLAPEVVATAVLAKLERDEPVGRRTLRWSNAGHPPPVLLAPDGSTRLLEADADLLLGLQPDSPRTDQAVELDGEASVVFYTDGLVERRGAPLEEGLRWLTGTLEGLHRLSAEQLCDHLLGEIGNAHEDDTALLVLRVRPG
jgi:serine phosphatase RsbU (regulator of sigma subunit)